MDIHKGDDTPGYYLVTIGSVAGRRYLRSNDERAFVIVQLQNLLSARSILEEPLPHRRLAAHIDLLAFSLQPTDVRLVIFSISFDSVRQLSRALTERLMQYQTDRSPAKKPDLEPTAMIVRLTGPHHALSQTVSLHLRHSDWEYDRYSSIGFFLHDRRGCWMRLWRITSLYHNDSALYRQMLLKTRSYRRARQPGNPATSTFEPQD